QRKTHRGEEREETLLTLSFPLWVFLCVSVPLWLGLYSVQSLPSGRPSRGCMTRFHVSCDNPELTVRTLPSPRPMFMALCGVWARQESQHVCPAPHCAAVSAAGLIWNMSVLGMPLPAAMVWPPMPPTPPLPPQIAPP